VDTRNKILTMEAAAGTAQGMAMAAGCFDVLLAEQVGELERARTREGLLAVVVEGASPILPVRARAEMVAALAVVDYVVIAPGNGELPDGWLEQLKPARVTHLEANHQRQLARLEAHVRRRQTA